MQRAPRAALPSLGIELIGDPECVGVELDDRVERRARLVDGADARKVLLGNPSRGPSSRGHVEGERGDSRLIKLEALDGGRLSGMDRTPGTREGTGGTGN